MKNHSLDKSLVKVDVQAQSDTAKHLVDFVCYELKEIKADKITKLNVSKRTTVTDYIVVCSANSKRHAKAIGEKLMTEAKRQKLSFIGMEGAEESEWILVDLLYVVVHIMLAETRDFYKLEDLWSENLNAV